jgi:hypothetical protein
MTSIYQRALGDRFGDLHPRIQERFGFASTDGRASIGRGVMERIWHGAAFTLPFLWFGAWRNILVPVQGRDVPFTIENYAYRDRFGRETVTFVRTFDVGRRPRRFDATMVYSEERGRVVDYLGTHQHLAVDLDLAVGPRGGIRIRTGAQRFYEGPVAFSFPLLFSGVADVEEWWDEEHQRYAVDVRVANRRFGPLFGYRGWFTTTTVACPPDRVPARVRPRREERRD